MAEFTARWNELLKNLKEVEKSEPIPLDLKSISFVDRYDRFRESLGKYIDWRDKALNGALPILKNESNSITGKSQREKWGEYFEKQSLEAFKMILGYVPDDENTPKLRMFAEATASQESGFFGTIGNIPLAWYQGQLQQYTREFYKEQRSLEEKWKKIAGQDKSIDAIVKNTSDKVLNTFKDVVNALVSQERAGETALKRAVATGKMAYGIPLEMKAALTAVQVMLSKIESYQKSLDDLAKIFMDAYKREETVVILFKQTRESVNIFLNETNLDTATDEFEQTCKNSLGMAGQIQIKGQQQDAKRYVEKAIPIVKDIFADFKKQYESFVRQHKGIFVGPVGDKTLEELLEKRQMEYSWKDIGGFNIQSKLKEVHNDCVRAWHVDIDDLDDKQKKEIEKFWNVELEKIGRGLRKAAEGSAWDRTKQIFTSKRKQSTLR